MSSAITAISDSFIPRVVTAGVPSRMPLVTIGLFVSNGIVFLLTVIHARSSASWASLPVTLRVDRSSSSRCVSVPPLTSRKPRVSSASASALAFVTICCW